MTVKVIFRVEFTVEQELEAVKEAAIDIMADPDPTVTEKRVTVVVADTGAVLVELP